MNILVILLLHGFFQPFVLIAGTFSPAAGTDEYLVEIGYTEEQLSTEASTENREAFEMAEGEGRIEDPLGDVVNRFGTTSSVKQPWGDIERAVIQKNSETGTWDVVVTLGGVVPEKPSMSAQLFVLLDTDGEKANNDRDGFRIGTDAEFSLQTTTEHPWYVDYRWYNPDPQFWAVNKETASSYKIDGDTITMHIPFSEAPESLIPHWRVVMGLADGAENQIDAVPGTGFPPPKGETYPSARADSSNLFLGWITWGIIGIIVGYGGYSAFARKQKKG